MWYVCSCLRTQFHAEIKSCCLENGLVVLFNTFEKWIQSHDVLIVHGHWMPSVAYPYLCYKVTIVFHIIISLILLNANSFLCPVPDWKSLPTLQT